MHHMETRSKDNNVEWKVFTLLGNNTVVRERFHSIIRNCNVRRVQAFQVAWVWNILGCSRKECTEHNSLATKSYKSCWETWI